MSTDANANASEAARIVQQRLADEQPCPRCGGDRLRPTFVGAPRCHAGGSGWLVR